jgi:SAM-dependent methyltransferase
MTQPLSRQDYGTDPLAVRDTNHYQAEYIHSFVEKSDALIDWDRRAESEGDFFIGALKEHRARKVLDVATGTGFHSVQLIEAGFEVTSADGSPVMLAKAFENARGRDHILRTVQADWRWLNRDVHDYYDAVICLGNSFTHLHEENDRRKALAEFYATLRHDGILILDQRNREMNRALGLDQAIDVVDGSFESIPAENASFDLAWSQDAILHSGHRGRVIGEIARVLRPGGELIFTDPMQADDCPEGVLQPVLDRIHLDSLGSIAFYREAAAGHGLQELEVLQLTNNLVVHYMRVREELERVRDELAGKVSDAYIERMLAGLGHWVEAGERGYLSWGVLHFRKPAG